MERHSAKAVAFHEAGHIVAAWATYRDVEFCAIRPGEGHDGRTRLYPPDHDRPSDIGRWSLDDIVDEIVRLLAGQLAEERLGGDGATGAGYHPADADGLNGLVEWSDAERIWNLVCAMSAVEEEQTAFLAWLTIRTSSLLDRYWHAVEAVASALRSEGELDDAALQALRMEFCYPVFPDDEIDGSSLT